MTYSARFELRLQKRMADNLRELAKIFDVHAQCIIRAVLYHFSTLDHQQQLKIVNSWVEHDKLRPLRKELFQTQANFQNAIAKGIELLHEADDHENGVLSQEIRELLQSEIRKLVDAI